MSLPYLCWANFVRRCASNVLVYLVAEYRKSIPAERPISEIASILSDACAMVMPYFFAKRSGVDETTSREAVGSSSKLFMTSSSFSSV